MTGLLAAGLAAYGTYLLYTRAAFGWRGLRPMPTARAPARRTLRTWLDHAGLYGVAAREVFAAAALLLVLGGAAAYAAFGGPVPALAVGAFAASAPFAAFGRRRARAASAARQAWPRMLEELRLLTGSLGRSIPQALFDVGRRAPAELRPAFAAAEREWLLSTDFERTVAVLEDRLADPTADAVSETLLVAYEVGGGDVDRQLEELVVDRLLDLQGRKDAESKQAGVRFARRFVLLVPLGMATAGLAIGTGRSAYESAPGQAAVVAAVLAVVACWAWSGRLLRLPQEPRVFRSRPGAQRPTLRPHGDAPPSPARTDGPQQGGEGWL